MRDELLKMRSDGFRRVKIKIGQNELSQDLRRIEIALEIFRSDHVAVDAMNAYNEKNAVVAAHAIAPYGLMWFEDVCDPHDFGLQGAVARVYPGPLAAGEPIFSAQEAALLADFGRLRSATDILVFDPAPCFGVTGFARILEVMSVRGWPRSSFWPHGGHLYSLHVAAAFGLGGVEVNPYSFAPFGGLAEHAETADGATTIPEGPGIGFEQ